MDGREPTNPSRTDKLTLSAKEVSRLTGLSRTHIWRLEKLGSFPARRQISPQRVAWLDDEVRAWARSLPVAGSNPASAEPCTGRGGREEDAA